MNHNNVPMTEILPYLYLGNRSDANNVNGLTANGIGFILNLTTSATEYPQESKITARHINILDSVYQCLKDTYQSAFDFIDEARKCNSKVLIHCEAGISRSPTITVAYLIYKNRMEALEAYNFVKKLRPIVSPNFGFMGQLMELENELVPEKVALRMEKEAKLAKETIRLQEEERLREAKVVKAEHPLIEKVVEIKLQLSKPSVRNTLSLNLKKATLPKPLSIDLPSPVLSAANKYVLPVSSVPQSKLVQSIVTEVSNQNLNPNVSNNSNSFKSSSCEKSITNTSTPSTVVVPKTISPTSTAKDCLANEDSLLPKSTSPPQLSNNSINKSDKTQSTIDESLIDSKTNISPSVDVVKVTSCGEETKSSIEDKLIINKATSTTKSTDKTSKLVDKTNDKSIVKPSSKVVERTDLINIKTIRSEITTQQTNNCLQQQSTPTNLLPRSVPTSNVCTPSTKQPTVAICLSDLLNPNSKSVSQNSLFISTTNNSSTTTSTKSQMKPLRPSTLNILNPNVPRKHNAITPSALCSPLAAFAVVSSSKSSPTLHTFPSNLSSPFDTTNEKLTKRRWLGETTCYQEYEQDHHFSPPECKKKNKQKKLKNISVEVN